MIPIHFGITGHRDIAPEDIPQAKSKLHSLISEYKTLHPNSEFRMLTLLAEGADSLAADVAIECGVTLIAVLPMPLSEYEKDFADTASLKRFREYWNTAEDRIELTLKSTENGLVERNAMYAAGGAFIAAHSQILIALWDGIDNGKLGGTAYVVKSKLAGDYSAWRYSSKYSSHISVPDSGPVFHIPVNRHSAVTDKANQALNFKMTETSEGGITTIFPDSWFSIAQDVGRTDESLAGESPAAVSEKYISKVLSDIDSFNRDCLDTSITSESIAKTEGNKLYPESEITSGQKKLLLLYGYADSMAIIFQKRYVKYLNYVANYSFFAFALYGVFDQFCVGKPFHTVFYAFFWLAIVVAFFTFKTAKKRLWEEKYYGYRALAEAIRVQLSWIIAGIPEVVSDHYLEKYTEKIPWLQIAVSNCSLKANSETLPPHNVALVKVGWVDDQYSFYSKSKDRKGNEIARAEHTSKWFVRFALVLFGIVGIWGFSMLADFDRFKELYTSVFGYKLKYYELLVYGFTFVLAYAGKETFVTEKRAINDEMSQYQRMAQIFGRGKQALEKPDLGIEDSKDILRELGKEALAENGDWLLYQRSKPLEMRWG